MKYNIDRLKYHPPTAVQKNTYEHINAAFVELVSELDYLVPSGANKTLMYRTIEEARMKANLAVALHNEPMYKED